MLICNNIVIILIDLVFAICSFAFFFKCVITYDFCRSYINMRMHIEKFAYRIYIYIYMHVYIYEIFCRCASSYSAKIYILGLKYIFYVYISPTVAVELRHIKIYFANVLVSK